MKQYLLRIIIVLPITWWLSGLFCSWCFSTNPNRLYAWFHHVPAIEKTQPINTTNYE